MARSSLARLQCSGMHCAPGGSVMLLLQSDDVGSCGGTCRTRGLVDAVIVAVAGRPSDQIDPVLLDLLRLGSYQLLRTGVALLGLRITVGQIADLGWQPVVLVLTCVVSTIGLSMLVARWLGFRSTFGMLTGGATAICGASAALALSDVSG